MAAPRNGLDLDAIRAELERLRDRTRERLAVLAERPERDAVAGLRQADRRRDHGAGDTTHRHRSGRLAGRVLARTERAVAKLDDGRYGIYDRCGDPTSSGRMRALPDGVFRPSCAASKRRAPRHRVTARLGADHACQFVRGW